MKADKVIKKALELAASKDAANLVYLPVIRNADIHKSILKGLAACREEVNSITGIGRYK